MDSARIARVRARRGKRGVALVESAAVLPLFVIMWFVTITAHEIGLEKAKQINVARGNAWGYAMANCGDTGSSNPTKTPSGVTANQGRIDPMFQMPPIGQMASSGGMGGWMSAIVSVISGFVQEIVPLAHDWDTQDIENKTVNYRIPDNYKGGGKNASAHTVTGNVVVTCNEAPFNGDLISALKWVWNAIKPW